jgi:predicted  nucleic acid-binding Zn-ribbon protein
VVQAGAREDVKKLKDRVAADNKAIDNLDKATKKDRADIKAAKEQRKRDRLALRDSATATARPAAASISRTVRARRRTRTSKPLKLCVGAEAS